MMENEASYLPAALPALAGAESKDITQHYLSEDKEPLRLRATTQDGGETYELTKKLSVSEGDLSRKDEINIPLTAAEYAMLLPLAKRGLEKKRWLVPLDGGLVAEIDVFKGPLEGFVKIEVEFPDDAVRAAFMPPSWFGREVSQEKWAKNSWLAGKTFADIEQHLK